MDKMTDPVARVVEIILAELRPRRQVDSREAVDAPSSHRVISYARDFDWAWRFEREFLDWLTERDRTVVLVWDGMPDLASGVVNVQQYLTPFDWAVCLQLALQEIGSSNGDAGPTSPRIVILDLGSREYSEADNVRLFRQLVAGGLVPGTSLYSPLQLGEFLDALLAEETVGSDETDAVDAGLLRSLWASMLVRPSADRHAISNLVGPLVLLGEAHRPDDGTLDGPGECAANALLQMLRHVGLISAGELASKDSAGSSPWKVDGDWEECVDRLALIDDMHHLGWGRLLRSAFGLSDDDDRLRCFADPTANAFGADADQTLVESLSLALFPTAEAMAVHDDGARLAGGNSEIIFLDLRLFAKSAHYRERAFIRELVSLARDVSSSRRARDWPVIGAIELDKISRWVESDSDEVSHGIPESHDYHLALTLLPRLMSLAFPRTPIVLFSSTGRREIVDRLRPYGNIQLQFDKPRFFGGDASDVARESAQRFRSAVAAAIRISRARKFCDDLESRVSLVEANAASGQFAEIFFDESPKQSNENFRVGGLVLIHESVASSEEFARAVDHAGLRWGPTTVNPDANGSLLAKYDDSVLYNSFVFPEFERILAEFKIIPIGFVLHIDSEFRWSGDPFDLASPSCMDNAFIGLLDALLEILLLEVLPGRCGSEGMECGVYPATRTRVRAKVDLGRWDELPRRYGVKIVRKDGQQAFGSLGPFSVAPIVASVLRRHIDLHVVVSAARGATLWEGKGALDDAALPLPQHWFADLVCRFGTPNSGQKAATVDRWLEAGFVSRDSAAFRASLEGCRHARFGRHVDALLAVWPFPSAIEKWAFATLSRSARCLTGPEFVRLAERMPKLAAGAASLRVQTPRGRDTSPVWISIGNLPETMDEPTLRRILGRDSRVVEEIQIVPSNERMPARARARFADSRHASSAVEMLNGCEFNGRALSVNLFLGLN